MRSRRTQYPLSKKMRSGNVVNPMESIEDVGVKIFTLPVDRPTERKPFYDVAKRLMDIVLSAILLLALSPLFFAVTLLVRHDSEGPAFFKQTRIGKNGKPFTFLKFRSMFVNNDNRIHKQYVTKYICGGSDDTLKGNSGSYKIERDPRITKIGRILRRTSIDELPQLINVLKGEMSLVGPRPPLPYEVELYSVKHKKRLTVVPGITGWWQINGRCEKDFEEMVHLDLYYVEHRSVLLDIGTLIKTIPVVLCRRGAW